MLLSETILILDEGLATYRSIAVAEGHVRAQDELKQFVIAFHARAPRANPRLHRPVMVPLISAKGIQGFNSVIDIPERKYQCSKS